MKANLCPVCNGSGQVYKSKIEGVSGTTEKETCHGCGGNGWVEVND